MKKYIFFFAFLVFSINSKAQSVGINTSDPISAAIFDIKANANTDHTSITVPKVYLSSKTDKTVINGGEPAESLIIYNTNTSITGGKGLYFWNGKAGNLGEWEFLVSQKNIDLFRNLTQYYTVSTQNSNTVSNDFSSTAYNSGDGTTGWTILNGDTAGQPLTMNVEVAHETNFLEVNLTGTLLITANNNLSHTFEFAYGIFIDGVLRYAKSDSINFDRSCNYTNFYVNSAIPNVSVGSHKITYGVRLRRIRTASSGNSNVTPAGLVIKVGGANSSCFNINAFESQTRATVFVNQTL